MTRSIPLCLSIAAFWLPLFVSTLESAEPDKGLTFLDPNEAGPDFALQGEYVGTVGIGTKLGAQVVALGNGQFDAVFYAGGLPGDGWDGKIRVHLSGETVDANVEEVVAGQEATVRKERLTIFKGKNFDGTIRQGRFSGTADRDVTFEMHKVERKSPTLGAQPPEGALVLFDGAGTDAWDNGRQTADKLLGVGTRTLKKFRDFTLHLEFRTPFMPLARGQDRGNSGMYLLDQYECQVLDSFGLSGEDNECGGIYKISKPLLNMCFPPLSWQTYDVEFQAAWFNDSGEKAENALVTIRHNGVPIHEDLVLPRFTPGGLQDDEQPGALYLQNHRNPVHFRNIWIVEN
jgi:hypothetical protein